MKKTEDTYFNKHPEIFLVFNEPNDQTEELFVTYECVICSTDIFHVIKLYDLSYIVDKFQDQYWQLNCNPVAKVMRELIISHTDCKEVQVNFCEEALVKFQAKLNTNKILNFILTWENCD